LAAPDSVLRAAAHFEAADDAAFQPLTGGLINETWYFEGPSVQGVLQRLHPIFGAELHHDIHAVTEHLRSRGMATPQLLHTRDGGLWADLDDGIWRAQTYVAGRTLHRADTPEQVEAAGALLGRFHRALADLDHEFRFARAAVHDTDHHLDRLTRVAAQQGDEHPRTRRLAGRIFEAASDLRELPETPERVLHGDPKLNNVRFDDQGRVGLCLIDLDTLRRGPLAHDLGDAWRSWCNRAGEDDQAARFDLTFLEAAARGYAGEAGEMVAPAEVSSLLIGLERISLELAARFCTDAFEDSYFGWDPARYRSRRHHNRVRADGQLDLHRAAVAARADAEAVVTDAFSSSS